jgi:ATP-binding cassette, subfamily B, bacterial PglK
MWPRFKKCLVLLPEEQRWRWASLIPLLLLTAVGEALGAAAVFALVKIVSDPAQVSSMPVASTLARWFPWHEPRQVILTFTGLVAAFYVGKNLLWTLTEYTRSRCIGEATAALSHTMLSGYLRASYPFHLQRNSAHLIETADRAVERVFTNVMSPVLIIITEVLVTAGILGVLLAAAPAATLIAVTVLLTLSAVFLRATRRQALRAGAQLQALHRAVLQHLQQALGGIKEVKVLGRERFFDEVVGRRQRALARVRYMHTTLSALPRIFVETIFICGGMFVVVLVTLGGSPGARTLSLLGLYAYAAFRIIPSSNRILWQLNEVRYGRASIDQVYNDLVAVRDTRTRSQSLAPFTFADRLVLDDVSYAYPGAERAVLHAVSLSIRRGESIGIVGPTGAGKSTLVDLIVALLEPSAGRITVDGRELSGCASSWQRQIGYVPQAIFLIDDTLRRNIALGIPDEDIDEEKVWAAVRLAQLEDLLASVPQGLDTQVGERGVRLSGGERQRVGIARALYHEPQVLIFDEATSALDNRTEAELTRAIESLREHKTLILIAHRLSTVRNCDRLVFLLKGRVAGLGAFDDLVASNADFRTMVHATEAA